MNALCTHRAKIICCEKIEKGVSKERILGHLRHAGYADRRALADMIEQEGIID